MIKVQVALLEAKTANEDSKAKKEPGQEA